VLLLRAFVPSCLRAYSLVTSCLRASCLRALPDEPPVQIPRLHADHALAFRLMLADQLAQAIAFRFVLAEHGHGVRLRHFGKLGQRLLRIRLKLLHAAHGQLRDEPGVVVQQARAA
jgi:hypothetical protein